MTLQSVGFVGAGLMGAGMARCILAAGHPTSLLVHKNRTPVDPLLAEGATEAKDLVTLLQGVEVVITCLPNADVVEMMADAIVPQMRSGQIWIEATTSRPEVSERLAARLAERGAIFSDAPVTGGPKQAEEGALASLVGCAEEHYPNIEALVSTYSRLVRRFGPAGRGHAAKLLNNLVTQGTTILLADAFQCAGKLGVDKRALYEVMMSGAARSGTLEKAVAPALDGNFDSAQFTIENAAKDLCYGRDLIKSLAPERAPVVSALSDRLAMLVAQDRGAQLVSAMLDPGQP
ncbi:NAD(P)-dependent oxidoreductase [Pacificibacter sp.]|uniref:NAD(P)-dependent oxidoreductase n=1 Tax=Pacificibacter sp. TaxID=1917866 RepID=UPI003219F44B